MEHPLVIKLKSLSMPELFPSDPASEEALNKLEGQYRLRFPEDYRQLMLYSNGLGLYEHVSNLNLEPVENLSWHNKDEAFKKHLPEMFVIGDDGGGSIYFFDPHNALGYDEYAIFLVPLAELAILNSIFVGQSLTEVINQILDDVDFFKNPRYGKDI